MHMKVLCNYGSPFQITDRGRQNPNMGMLILASIRSTDIVYNNHQYNYNSYVVTGQDITLIINYCNPYRTHCRGLQTKDLSCRLF